MPSHRTHLFAFVVALLFISWGCTDTTTATDSAAPADVGPSTPCIETVLAEHTPCGPGGGEAGCAACVDPAIMLTVTEDKSCATPLGNKPCKVLDPKHCFVGAPPAPDAERTLPPAPQPTCCGGLPTFEMEGLPSRAPSLEVEVGLWDRCIDRFVPHQDHQWTPLVVGTQGLFHVYASVRVKLPGRTGEFAYVNFSARALDGCTAAATATAPALQLSPDPEREGWWTYQHGSRPGIFVIFPHHFCAACLYCGNWLDLRVAVKDGETGAWGEARASVRTYIEVLPPGLR